MRKKVSRILLIIIASSLIYGSSFAQQDHGIHFGYIESKLDKGSAGIYDKGYSSFFVGMYNDQKIVPMIYFNTALDYYQTGSKADDKNKLVFHYISVPIALKLKIGPVQAFGGVHGALKVSSQLQVSGESSSAEGASTFDAGGFVGAGIKVLFLGVEGKYNWGFVDIYRGYKNNFFQVGLTLWF